MEALGVEPARRMIANPSAAPTCTVITATWRFRDEAGEGGWESLRSGESGSSGRQVGDKSQRRATLPRGSSRSYSEVAVARRAGWRARLVVVHARCWV